MSTIITYKNYKLIEDPGSPGNPKADCTGAGGDLVQDNFKFLADNSPLLSALSTKTTTYAILSTDTTILCDPTSANFTVTLPTAVSAGGKRYVIKRISSSTNLVTIATTSSQTIDGSTTYKLRSQDESIEIVSDGSNWRAITNYAGVVPVGSVIAWLKSYTSVPSLPSGYVECNGQTLSDASSVFNGQVIPNLNASGGGTQRFLRGSTTSGTTGGSDSHTHSLSLTTAGISYQSGATGFTAVTDASVLSTTDIPSYYEVCWIIRIK